MLIFIIINLNIQSTYSLKDSQQTFVVIVDSICTSGTTLIPLKFKFGQKINPFFNLLTQRKIYIDYFVDFDVIKLFS